MRGVILSSIAVVLTFAGCGAGDSSSGPSPSTSSSAAGGGTPSPSERDLGPDPGVDAYRSLDLCALAPVAAVEAAYRNEGGTGPVTASSDGPALCFFAPGSGGGSHLEFALPRDRLPADVRMTNPGVNKVDATSAGALVYDPAIAIVHVLSASGYLVRVTGPGDTVNAQHLTLALAKVVRQSLTQAPPQLAVPETAVSGRNLCDAVRKADVMGALGLQAELQSSADGRACELSDSVWVSFHGRGGYPPDYEVSKVPIGPATAQVRRHCDMIIPIRPAPPGAGWEHDSLLASSVQPEGPDCDRFVGALAPLVELLT
ncbi:hypothetical protein ACOCJ7_19815 [Knoellia sp. CPCC 206453]|uniref:hypothetical protein n=1 Tax=Knoellia pratensis TaxID=3404796 RepID=UPI003618E50F